MIEIENVIITDTTEKNVVRIESKDFHVLEIFSQSCGHGFQHDTFRNDVHEEKTTGFQDTTCMCEKLQRHERTRWHLQLITVHCVMSCNVHHKNIE